MTHLEIERELRGLIVRERKITTDILKLINLAFERKTYLERGYPSMFEWLTKSFGYSESAAQRRIQAARMLKAVPQASELIESGVVNITTVAKAESFVRAQQKISGQLSNNQKEEVIAKICNKSGKEAEKELVNLFPDVVMQKPEVIQPVAKDLSRVSLNLNDETLADLKRAQELLSHAMPNASLAEVVAYVAKQFLAKKDPLRKAKEAKVKNQEKGNIKSESSKLKVETGELRGESGIANPFNLTSTAAASKQRVRISLPVKKGVIQKAHGQCEYIDPITNKRCQSRFQLELDHILPRALGGNDEPKNLRCLCRVHNQQQTRKKLGEKWASHWRQEK